MNDISMLYINGESITKICSDLNISHYMVSKILKKDGVKKRTQSECLSIYYKMNPDNHPLKKNSKFISIPCEKFKSILKNNNVNFIEEYSDFIDHSYSIDVALPEYKIGFEINGNQHYNKDGSLKDYYYNRERYIESFGWKIYQIHYSLCYNEMVVLSTIKNSILGRDLLDFNYNEYLIKKLNTKIKIYNKNSKCLCGNEMHKSSSMCAPCNRKLPKKRKVTNRPKIEILLNEVNEFGYRYVGRKYGVSDNSIRKWIRWGDI